MSRRNHSAGADSISADTGIGAGLVAVAAARVPMAATGASCSRRNGVRRTRGSRHLVPQAGDANMVFTFSIINLSDPKIAGYPGEANGVNTLHGRPVKVGLGQINRGLMASERPQ